jgi:peptide/nickel transport system substrate-binding protein
MPSTFSSRHVRRSALALALGGILAAGLSAPAAAPVRAADPLVLRVGTTQDLDSLNPYATALVVGYEAFLLNYNLLVDFGPDLEPVPGFAESWTRAADGKSWTFKIRPGMTWSDGTPATADDACFSFQLALDAIENETNVGLGYIDPSLKDAGATKVECPDATTMVMYTTDASDRILQTYIPILPKHILGTETYKTLGDAKFDAPLVGTGPYQVAEWKTGEYVRFTRNLSYWGKQGAADEIVIQFFKNNDTMVQALKAGEIDYARGLNSDQLNQIKTVPDIQTVVGTSNGWTELGFNTYGTGTGKTIPDGGPSTKALLDPAFRDAIGYAIDKQTLLDRILGGYGTIGTTQVPPVLAQWHVDPADPRVFSIDTAKQKLDAAGYVLDANGRRLDKEGKPINLRLYMPDSDDTYPKVAQFVQDWLGQLGIKITTQVFDSGTLTDLMLPPEAGGAGNKANYDLFIWSWAGNPDPNALLQIFECSAIGSSSDSNWCDPAYDTMFADQNVAPSAEARKAILAQMQELFYEQAPYHILYYDSELHAYRTDRFTNWQKQPTANGTPLFTYGTLNYTLLEVAGAATPSPTAAPTTAASAGASAAPTASSAPATAAPSPTPGAGTGDSGGGSLPLLILGGAALVVVLAVGFVALRRRGPRAEEE